MTRGNNLSPGRLVLIALILVLGAFWVGARYGPRQANDVEAHRIAESPNPAHVPNGAAGARAIA